MIDAALLPLDDGVRALRPLRTHDAAAYAAGTRDPLVREHAHLPEPHYTTARVEEIAREVVPAGLARGDLALLAIVDAGDDLLGSLVLFDVGATSAEVGFWLLPAARGAGHAGGALELAARLAAGSGLRTLTARTVTANAPSLTTLGRAGFTEVARAEGRTPSGAVTALVHLERELA